MYGEDYNEENEACGKVTEASRKRKAATENAKEKFSKYEWEKLAESGQVLTFSKLHFLLRAAFFESYQMLHPLCIKMSSNVSCNIFSLFF